MAQKNSMDQKIEPIWTNRYRTTNLFALNVLRRLDSRHDQETAEPPRSTQADRANVSSASHGNEPRIQAESADGNILFAAGMTSHTGLRCAAPLPQILRQAASLPFDRRFLRDPLAQYSQSQSLPLKWLQLVAVVWSEKTSGQRSSGETTIQALKINANGLNGPGHCHRITAVTEADPTPARRKSRWSTRRGS